MCKSRNDIPPSLPPGRGAAFGYNRRGSHPRSPSENRHDYCVSLQGGRLRGRWIAVGHDNMGDDTPDDLPETPPGLTAAPAPACNPAEPAAGEIYVEYAPLLRRVAIRKFAIPIVDAEALVHDVFIGYLSDPRRVRVNLRGYLIASICNACRKYWNSRNSESRIFSDAVEVDEAVAEETFDGLDRTLLVAATLARLPARYRDVLKRYYLEGQDTKTIADALGTTPTNVNYLMHVCRVRARDIYHELNRVP